MKMWEAASQREYESEALPVATRNALIAGGVQFPNLAIDR
jgi:hypothetical protein